ncbi:MAG: DUF3987 domain-containing protein [Reyranella sp.]|uniref:DUF3987 domain-containing protein n=1 Tax=Reyranella sp. TaxID=1929291 RepID=UPI003D0AA0EF
MDYVAQGLLASVAALTGAGVQVQPTPGWHEPLVLWLALVGNPSAGKSPALSTSKRLLDAIEGELRASDEERQRQHATKIEQARLLAEKWKEECEAAMERGAPAPIKPVEAAFDEKFIARQVIVADATVESLADVVSGNPCGVVLWRDELAAWLGNLGRYSNGSDRPHYLEAWAAAGVTINRKSRSGPLHLRRFPVSIVGTIQPDRLVEALAGADDGMAARFLYVWPDTPTYRSIRDRRVVDDESALTRLKRISAAAGEVDNPRVLTLSDEALQVLDTFCADLHADAQNHEGLEAGFLGKGRGTVVRLAAVLALLRWSESDAAQQITNITADDIKDAAGLWSDYFRPHAQAAIYRAGRSKEDRLARKAAHWLMTADLVEVSRETIRRDALGQTIDAAGADAVIARLVEGNVLREMTLPAGLGRPPKRWAVNPSLSQRGPAVHA